MRTILLSTTLPILLFGFFAACGDSETSTEGAGGGGDGGAGGSAETCAAASDCTAPTCGASEAVVVGCSDEGVCETSCEAATACTSECTAPTDCMFDGDMCPPPNTDPQQECFEGKCEEFCGAASDQFCLTDSDCPLVQCPGSSTSTQQCLGGGCVDAARRCCS